MRKLPAGRDLRRVVAHGPLTSLVQVAGLVAFIRAGFLVAETAGWVVVGLSAMFIGHAYDR